jgi:hypothetical protein
VSARATNPVCHSHMKEGVPRDSRTGRRAVTMSGPKIPMSVAVFDRSSRAGDPRERLRPTRSMAHHEAITRFCNHERLSHKPKRLYEIDNDSFHRPRGTASGGRSGLSASEKTRSEIGALSRTHKKSRTRRFVRQPQTEADVVGTQAGLAGTVGTGTDSRFCHPARS